MGGSTSIEMLTVAEHLDGVVTSGGNVVAYDVMRNQAHFGAADVDGHAIVWEVTNPPAGDWIVRCAGDRIPVVVGAAGAVHPLVVTFLRPVGEADLDVEQGIGRAANVLVFSR